jgi:hypothetical protein
MTKTASLTVIVIALVGCNGPDTGSPPDDAIEVTQQKALLSAPWGPGVPVRAMFGRVPGVTHWLIYQRLDNNACSWTSHGWGEHMDQDLWVNLSEGNDTGIVASPWGSTMICNGTITTLYSPSFVLRPNGYYGSVRFFGLGGNDTLHCAGRGGCDGGDGDDTLIGWEAESGGFPGLTLNGDAGRDKLLVYGDWPVALYGGSGPDCLGVTHPGSVTAYNCASYYSKSDPDIDASAGWIGPWCNQLTTDLCLNW